MFCDSLTTGIHHQFYLGEKPYDLAKNASMDINIMIPRYKQ